MSLRPRILQEQVITNGDMSGSIPSLITILGGCSIGSYQFIWAGSTPVGTIQIEVSNDYTIYPNGTVNNVGHWNPIYFSLNGGATAVNSIPVSGNTGMGYISWADKPFAIKAIYTPGSGTGTLQAFANLGVT